MSTTDTDAVTLKPCPFCGSGASFNWYNAYSTDSSFEFVGCTDGQCGVMIEVIGQTREQAAEVWNRRASAAPTGDAVEVARELTGRWHYVGNAAHRELFADEIAAALTAAERRGMERAAYLEYNDGISCGYGAPINPDGPEAADALDAQSTAMEQKP